MLQFMGSRRVRQDLVTEKQQQQSSVMEVKLLGGQTGDGGDCALGFSV